jgi:dUTP pyrophosphatase
VTIPLDFQRLPGTDDIPLPRYQTDGAAGLDLHAAVTAPLTLGAGERGLVPCGFCVAIPAGYEGQVRPRSGLAVKHGLTVLNAPGTVDSDYRGEIKVPLINHGAEPFVIERGARIAQLVICPVARATLHEVKELTDTTRGIGGFGHTGG